jgi:hypothetical protein
MNFTCGDRIVTTDNDSKIRVCLYNRVSSRLGGVLCYLEYDVERGSTALQTELRVHSKKYRKDEGEMGVIGEKIRCLRNKVCGQVLRKYFGGEILFCETELGNYFITHRLFTIDFVDTRLCDELREVSSLKRLREEDEETQWPSSCPS